MDGQNFSFVTLEYLEAYGARLRWNSAFNIPINGLAAFLILKYSTPAMGIYKYFILATVISAFLMDFHSSFIYGFYNFVPLTVSCPTGITKSLGWFWGNAVNYIIIHFNMSFCGLSLTYSIVYQYFSLTNRLEVFQKPITIFVMFATAIFYPMPSAILYILCLDYESGKAYVYANYPDIAKIFVTNSCSMQIFWTTIRMYWAVSAIQISALFVFAVIIGIKLSFKLEEVKHSLSVATLKAHKQYILALFIQGTVPFTFIVIPVIFMIITLAFNLSNTHDLFEWTFQCFGLHSLGNAIAVMYIIKPYQKALTGWKKRVTGVFHKKSVTKVFPVNSVAASTTMNFSKLH